MKVTNHRNTKKAQAGEVFTVTTGGKPAPRWLREATGRDHAGILAFWGEGATFKRADWERKEEPAPVVEAPPAAPVVEEPAHQGEPATVEAPAQEEARPVLSTPLQVACPACSAGRTIGEPCRTYRGHRKPACPERKAALAAHLEAERSRVAARCEVITQGFKLESPPDQLGFGFGAFGAPCVKPARPVAQATEPAPLFGKVSP